MNDQIQFYNLKVTDTNKKCQIGETVATQNMQTGYFPVLSCEGACIKGEIARLAANMIAKEKSYNRACHGELLSVPTSAMAKWIKESEKVILVDGCFIRCHGRILENLIDPNHLVQFDALSIHKKYADKFDIDSVPEKERVETARFVAETILNELKNPQLINNETTVENSNCCSSKTDKTNCQ